MNVCVTSMVAKCCSMDSTVYWLKIIRRCWYLVRKLKVSLDRVSKLFLIDYSSFSFNNDAKNVIATLNLFFSELVKILE